MSDARDDTSAPGTDPTDIERHRRIKDVFLEALDLDSSTESDAPPEDLAERLEALLTERFPDDGEARDEVRALLEIHQRTAEIDALKAPEPVDETLPAGTVVSERYRIVSRLGRGGMGEVYRADDLVIGEPVALKFLRADLPLTIAQLSAEVRLSRQVTHPNVCRVFDVGEVGGRPFLSMEYIDGEDLASLLNRIGRLPTDLGVAVARQLFAGLAAAHARGVLHRDLKPANLMIDGRGQVKITDFGIASLEDGSAGPQLAAGTLAYMAPEQLQGRETTAQSDLYCLGLVLYEACTGRHPFDDPANGDLIEAQLRQTPAPPSSRVDEIEPVLDRLILRCLEKDPADRPTSALAVAAALPGGDPLELAASVGETPTPDLVARAGGAGGLERRTAVILGVLTFVLGLLCLSLAPDARRLRDAPLDLAPEVLAEKARQLLRDAGWTEEPYDQAWGFLENPYALHSVRGDAKFESSAPGTSSILFWYRASPYPLLASEPLGSGSVFIYDPPPREGDALVILHPLGTLDHFEVFPTEMPPIDPIPMRQLATWAGLDPASLREEPTTFSPPFYADERLQLFGHSSARPDLELQVRLARFGDRPTLLTMSLVPPDDAMHEEDPSDAITPLVERAFDTWYRAYDLLLFFSWLAAIVLAHHNVKRGRGDQRGATRLAVFLGMVSLAEWAFSGPHLADLNLEWSLLNLRLASILFDSVQVWLFYLALEPYVRRTLPHVLIAWTRLLRGRWYDALVGRSLAIGATFGAFWAVIAQLDLLLPRWFGLLHMPEPIESLPLDFALSASSTLGATFLLLRTSLYEAVFSLLVYVLLRRLLAHPMAAAAAYLLLFGALYTYEGAHLPTSWLTFGLLIAGTEMLVLLRYGLLAFASAAFVFSMLRYFPLTTDTEAWFFGASLYALLVALAVSSVGLWRARRPVVVRQRRDSTITHFPR